MAKLGKTTTSAKLAQKLQAPSPATFGSVALAQLAAAGNKQATAAASAIQAASAKPAIGTVAPVGVATRNAGQAATMPGFAAIGVNGRKQPLASSVTAAIWQAALTHQLGNAGAMPTQATIKLACPTVNPTSCGLGLTQYKAYTGQSKGSVQLTLTQLQALAIPAKPAK